MVSGLYSILIIDYGDDFIYLWYISLSIIKMGGIGV